MSRTPARVRVASKQHSDAATATHRLARRMHLRAKAVSVFGRNYMTAIAFGDRPSTHLTDA
ncbi:MAG: hypothetical protein ACRENI_14510 [Gemmatimonadaceae bacterium]